ncbi:MAG TPA: mannose-1-phosphate guanylyltransferase [Bacteroidetes bacterium]|nr:mannose-1-phosphate guanylyltransferase [Bacteroidota bacterium]
MRINDYVIIMAGGIGSRFWPMSRSAFPKQFHDILGIGKTMIQMTYDRFLEYIPAENILIVTNERYRDLVLEQLPQLRESELLLEPVGRNTAPCIAYAAYKIRQRNPEACVLVAGSDYLILNTSNFRNDVELGLDECRKQDIIMTLGIRPTRPDTGYGYIQYIEPENELDVPAFYKLKTFTEKPELEMAENFLRSGDFLWNSGMFIFSIKTLISAFQTYMPDLSEIFEGICEKLDTNEEAAAIGDAYLRCRNDSIDTGVMEKAENVYVIPSSFDWSDLGTWGSVYEHVEQDYLGNAVQGKVVVYDSANNMVRMNDQNKLVVLNGLNNYIVVDTGDVLMICKKENEQEIKTIVADMRKNFGGDLV